MGELTMGECFTVLDCLLNTSTLFTLITVTVHYTRLHCSLNHYTFHYIAQGTAHAAQCTLHSSHCTAHTAHYTLHSPHWTVHTALFFVQSTSVHCVEFFSSLIRIPTMWSVT